MLSGTEFIVCPICSKIIHRHDARPITSRAQTSSRSTPSASAALLTEMMLNMEREHQERIQAAEAACRSHYANRHPVRLWLWSRFHYNRVMNKRWIFWGVSGDEMFNFPQGDDL